MTDALEWAIDQGAEECTFVLNVILEKRTTVKEAARIIGKNLRKLYQSHPDLVERQFMTNSFSLEMGRFSVPKGVFDEADDNPFVVMTDEVHSWDVSNSQEAKNFWIDNHENLANKIEKAGTGHEVEAVWKFVCIEQFLDKLFREAGVVTGLKR